MSEVVMFETEITRAVAAERERCAGIADRWAEDTPPSDPMHSIALLIAEEIRRRA